MQLFWSLLNSIFYFDFQGYFVDLIKHFIWMHFVFCTIYFAQLYFAQFIIV